MKKTIFGALLLLSMAAMAQDKFTPSIKQGAVLQYDITLNGQSFIGKFSLDSVATNYVKVGWNIDQVGTGAWVMKGKSLTDATRGWWGEPQTGITEEIQPDQAVLILSKVQWASLQKDKKFTYDAQTFVVKQPAEKQVLKLDGKTVDAILAENEKASTRLWILNNPSYPIILKIEGNTLGADLSVTSIK